MRWWCSSNVSGIQKASAGGLGGSRRISRQILSLLRTFDFQGSIRWMSQPAVRRVEHAGVEEARVGFGMIFRM